MTYAVGGARFIPLYLPPTRPHRLPRAYNTHGAEKEVESVLLWRSESPELYTLKAEKES